MIIALICPSNVTIMPYVKYYTEIFSNENITFKIIEWNRLKYKTAGEFVFLDEKNSHSRNLIDYVKFGKYVSKILLSNNFDRIIFFGLALIQFINKRIFCKYRKRYIIDIRDYHKLMKFKFLYNYSFKNANLITISSEGFKKWLPWHFNYLISHNVIMKLRKEKFAYGNFEDKINIAYIGSIRDIKINEKLIKSLSNDAKFNIIFHGDGPAVVKLTRTVLNNKINNVEFTGRYDKEIEDQKYKTSHLITVLLPNSDINSKTLLPNRLYNAVLFGIPLVASKGTYTGMIVDRYKLGVKVDLNKDIKKQILEYLNNYNDKIYMKGLDEFIKIVDNDQIIFREKIKKFIHQKGDI